MREMPGEKGTIDFIGFQDWPARDVIRKFLDATRGDEDKELSHAMGMSNILQLAITLMELEGDHSVVKEKIEGWQTELILACNEFRNRDLSRRKASK